MTIPSMVGHRVFHQRLHLVDLVENKHRDRGTLAQWVQFHAGRLFARASLGSRMDGGVL